MKKVLNTLFIGAALVATSCSEPTEYELPYELSPTTQVSLEVTSSAASVSCPGPTATITTDATSDVVYIVVPAEVEAPNSLEIYNAGNEVSFEQGSSIQVDLTGLDLDADYTLYAVTINENGIRSEAVTSQSFSTSAYDEVINATLATDFTGMAYYSGTAISPVSVTFDPSAEGTFSFNVEDLWGPEVVAALAGNPALSGIYPYPATITINPDFSVTVVSEEELGGEGSYDPCTGAFNLTLLSGNIFTGDPLSIDVVLEPATGAL